MSDAPGVFSVHGTGQNVSGIKMFGMTSDICINEFLID